MSWKGVIKYIYVDMIGFKLLKYLRVERRSLNIYIIGFRLLKYL